MPSQSDRFWLAVYLLAIFLVAASDFLGMEGFRLRGLLVAGLCIAALVHVHRKWTIDFPHEEDESLREKHEVSAVDRHDQP